jgi:cell surface protein SprA
LNYNNDPQTGGDGFLILYKVLIDSQNGRLIFTTKEPFGELLFSKLSNTGSGENYDDASTYNPNQKKYVLEICIAIHNQVRCRTSIKINFFKGKYKSTGGDGIPIGAFNVPRGSVVVTGAEEF